MGTTITTVAASLQVYDLSHSSLEVGALASTGAEPMVLGMLGGGAAWLIPLIAGLLLARFRFAPAFGVDALSFLVFTVLAAGMRPVPQTGSAGAGLSSFGAGLRYVRG